VQRLAYRVSGTYEVVWGGEKQQNDPKKGDKDKQKPEKGTKRIKKQKTQSSLVL
jgi:hypothetical protein